MIHHFDDSVTLDFACSPRLRLVLSYLSDMGGNHYCGAVYRSSSREPLFYARCSGENPPHLKYVSNFDVPDLFIGEASFCVSERDLARLEAWLKQNRSRPHASTATMPGKFKPLGLVSMCQGFA